MRGGEEKMNNDFIVVNIHSFGSTAGIENYETSGTSNSFLQQLSIEKVTFSEEIIFEEAEKEYYVSE